jgi:hypothetical protein
MIGRFTSTRNIDELGNHLRHGRIVYAFTGCCFIILYYDSAAEKGLIRKYNIKENMSSNKKEVSLVEVINGIREGLKDSDNEYLLYFGELSPDDSIYKFMGEFYNPKEELPIVVSSARLDAGSIVIDVSCSSKVENKTMEMIHKLNHKLLEDHIKKDIIKNIYGTYNIFSIWLEKNGKRYKVVFRSSYNGCINNDKVLSDHRNDIINTLMTKFENLGIKVSA